MGTNRTELKLFVKGEWKIYIYIYIYIYIFFCHKEGLILDFRVQK